MSLEELDVRFVMKHRGSYSQFLERYELAASEAREGNRKSYNCFCQDLMTLVSDPRNLMAAAEHLRHNGGTAPGRDGILLSDFSRIDLWAAVRNLRDQLCSGAYERGRLKRCQVPKHYGSLEKRTIWLMRVIDRIVTRGATQILTPLLKPVVDPLSFCWRRRGGRLALAFAQRRLVEEGRTTWIVEDARNAFDRVSRPRLLQILRHYVPNDAFCRLVMHLVEPPTQKGVLQGSAASMALLDVYFSHLLHRPWRRENLPPLSRYADDLLVSLRPEDDVAANYERLNYHFQNAGMQPKYGFNNAVVDLRCETAQWLGYRLRWRQGQLEIRPKLFDSADPGQAHDYIFSKFAVLHDSNDGWRNQNQVLRGMIAHLAPTLPFVDPKAVYRTIAVAAREAGFEEIWSLPDVLDRWHADYRRWQWVCERIDELLATSAPIAKAHPATTVQAAAVFDPSVPPWE